MSDFIPPFPERFPGPLPFWKRLLLARRNLIGMWEEEDFARGFVSTKLLSNRAFLCNNPDAVRFALSTHNASFERKSPQMRHALAPLLGDGLFISDGETWRERRQVIAPIVHVSRLSEFAPVMVSAAAATRDHLVEHDGGEIDILAESANLTADIICRALFGHRLSRIYAQEIVSGFSEYQRLIGQSDLFSLLGLPDWVPRWYSPAVRRSVSRMHKVLEHVIDTYRASEAREESLIGRLLAASDTDAEAALSAEALRNEIAVLFMAGHETTANSLAWTWYLLSQAPDVEACLHDELYRVLGGRLPTLADVPDLVYTRAVFEETLRLYPPVPILPREALTEERYDDCVIPRGSLIFVVPWLLHRNPTLWDRPDHFDPDRFLAPNADRISKFSYVPFSVGPRVCAGLSFGLTEAVLCIATLAQSFAFRLRAGYDVRPVARLTLRPDGGLPMTVVRRTRAARNQPETIGQA